MRRWCAFSIAAVLAVSASANAAPALKPAPEQVPKAELQWAGGPPGKVYVGDRVEVQVRIQNGQGLSQPLKIKGAKGWHIDKESVQFDAAPGLLKFSIVPLNAGPQETPEFMIKDGGGKSVVKTTALAVEVGSASEKDKNPPPKTLPPAEIEFPVWEAAGLALIALIVLSAGGYGVYRLVRRLRAKAKARELAKPVVVEPVDTKYIQKLEKHGAKKLWEQGKFKPHYFGVSDLVKAYIEDRFRFEAKESTTEEVLRGLRDRVADSSVASEFESLFRKMDIVKFTETIPETSEARELVAEAVAFIRKAHRAI